MTAEHVTVERRFCGPPSSGNGGYVSGLLAGHVPTAGSQTAEITLRRPPPLDVPLAVVTQEGSTRLVGPDGELVAEGVAVDAQLGVDVPEPVGLDEARTASSRYPGFEWHPFPTCFTCGPERGPGDGLRIFPGRTGDRWAAPWAPPASLGSEGVVPEPVVWAALDCPSGHAVIDHAAGMICVLGRLAAVVIRPVPVGGELVAMAWSRGIDGRKRHSASALVDGDGQVLALARATWIEVSAPPT